MNYVPIPVDMLETGKPLPVDVWSPNGQLLLRKGQPVVSAQHKEKLKAHNASSTEGDAMAWQRSYERMVHHLLRQGIDVQVVAQAPMPSEIREIDYVVVKQITVAGSTCRRYCAAFCTRADWRSARCVDLPALTKRRWRC